MVGKKELSNALVTGGAGFIGSHLVDRLMESGYFVRVVDNLSSGSLKNVERWLDNARFEFVQGDLKDMSVARQSVEKSEIIYHLAANPEVRVEQAPPSIHFNENLLTTFNVLEAMRESRNTKAIAFFSSSTIYGEPEKLPTSEDYGPLFPISVYGASKLGCEALISSYCHMFDFRGVIFRLANIVGSRSSHGVVVDFVRKLRENPKELEILGDGCQSKSYLHIDDFIDAVSLVLRGLLDAGKTTEVYNVGSQDQVGVIRIAEITAEEMGLKNVDFKLTGGIDGGRGWRGDVRKMFLSDKRLLNLGWKPSMSSEEAVRLSCRELLHSMRGKK